MYMKVYVMFKNFNRIQLERVEILKKKIGNYWVQGFLLDISKLMNNKK